MNCKPGDLAVIVSSTGATAGWVGDVSRATIGRIGRVTRLRSPKSPQWCSVSEVWEFETPFKVYLHGSVYEVTGCADDDLRPIRDPGDDAQDETLEWLSVPRVKEPA